MNGISHKQAIKWIHRRLDGLLNNSQDLLLEEHLTSCDTCRAYASEISILPTSLQSEFHARWDPQRGPSEKVLETVATKARRIPLTNRISSGAKLFAGLATLLALAFLINFVISRLQGSSTSATQTETPDSSSLAEDRLLAFASDRNGNFDIYTLHADGSGLTNLTNNPAQDVDPFWSPDGKRIAFGSGRDGFAQIYLMDADGSNVIQLTNDEAFHKLVTYSKSGPWSPDGSKLIFWETLPGEDKQKLYVIDANGENKTPLVDEPDIYSAISWSPDGQHVAFLADDPQRLGGNRIYVVNADGSGLKEVTESLDQNEQLDNLDYYWSPDSQSIFFVAFFQKTNPYWTAYEARLDDNSLIEHATASRPMYGWWNGTSLYDNFIWARPDQSTRSLDPYQNCQSTDRFSSESGSAIARSPNGNWVVSAYCSNGDGWFYWVNSDGTIMKPLLTSPIPTTNMLVPPVSWAPDEKFIAITLGAADASDIYIFNVSGALSDQLSEPVKISKSYGPSWQPLSNHEAVMEKPTTEPSDIASDNLIAFASDQNGDFDIYTMQADGSGLTNITNNPALDSSPFWSPDGRHVAFASDRDGSNQLYLMDSDGSNVIQLTDGAGYYWFDVNGYTPWSPDGRKLVFSHKLSGEQNYKLYVMTIADKTITPLTTEAGQYLLSSWSADGRHLAFIADTGGTRRDLFIVESDGSHLLKLTESLPSGEFFIFDYEWSQQDTSLFFTTNRNQQAFQDATYRATVYEANVDGSMAVVTGAKDRQILDWWNGTALIDNPENSLTWLRPDGSQSTLELCQNGQLLGIAHKRSAQGDLVVASNCSDGGWILYWANSDGTITDQLLNLPIPLDQESLFNLTWSPDDQSLAFVSLDTASPDVTETLYVLDVAKARDDPSIQPLKMTNSLGPSWQPVHTPNSVENSPELKIDPQSCKSFSDPGFDVQPPSQLYGYEPIQGISFVDGDFSYEFWLYCDPSLQPDDQENRNAIAGLGIFASWNYTGPKLDGQVEYYYAFEPDVTLGGGSWDGPFYSASITGAKFGINLSKPTIQAYIQQGDPIPFRTVVDSPLGHNGAIFSFQLEPTEQGLRVTNLHTEAEHFTSAGSNLIAFVSNHDGNKDIYVVTSDGNGLKNLTNNPAEDTDPVWSPDGKRIAFISNRDGDKDIYVMSTDGSELAHLTDQPGEDINPIWSPDGTMLAYAAYDPDTNAANVYVVDSEGKTHRRLTDNDSGALWPVEWSADGEYIFYDHRQIKKIKVSGGEGITLTSQEDAPYQFVLNAAGLKILYLTGCDNNSAEFCNRAKTVDVDGANEKTLDTMNIPEVCPVKQTATWMGYQTKWSPDRTKLIFAFTCEENGWIYIANADGSDLKPLTNYPILGDGPQNEVAMFDWSPDSQSIVFMSALDSPESEKLYILNINDALQNLDLRPSPLNISVSQISSPAWQPVR